MNITRRASAICAALPLSESSDGTRYFDAGESAADDHDASGFTHGWFSLSGTRGGREALRAAWRALVATTLYSYAIDETPRRCKFRSLPAD